jgi:hypothetical protein
MRITIGEVCGADLDLGVLDYWGDVRGYRADHGRVQRRVY